MATAGDHAQGDGLADAADLETLDLSGLVARRAEAQRSFLTHPLNAAVTSPDLGWLPARVNLYTSSLYGAYNQGYGAAVQATNPSYQLVWRLGSSEHCRLCLDRAGQVFTFQNLPGWPGDGGFGGTDAICLGGANCKCSYDYVENGQTLASGGNTLQQAGYYSQQRQTIQGWRDDAAAARADFLAGLPNETGGDGTSVQSRAASRDQLRAQLADLLNQRIRSTGGYGGVSVEPTDIPASIIASILPQYGPIPDDVPLTALMDAVDQMFQMKGAALDLTKGAFTTLFLDAVTYALKHRYAPVGESVDPAERERRVTAELEAAARHIAKGLDPADWECRHVTAVDVFQLSYHLQKGRTPADRARAVRAVLARRRADVGGQVIEPDDGTDDTEPSGDGGDGGYRAGGAAGAGGPVKLPHDADDIYHGDGGDRSSPVPRKAIGKDAADPHDPNPVEAEHVVNQMLQNYPEKALRWMRGIRWIGPVEVPVDRVDTDSEAHWAANHQPSRVRHFAKKLKRGETVNPGVSVQEPGENKIKVIDGHHRYLAAVKAKQGFRTYIGFVDENGGPWDETHVYQFHQGASPQNKGFNENEARDAHGRFAPGGGHTLQHTKTGKSAFATAEGDDNFTTQRKTVSKVTNEALNRWTTEQDLVGRINSALRVHNNLQKLTGGDFKVAQAIKRAINDHVISKDTQLWRGASLPAHEVASWKPGHTITDKGFMATSTSRGLAEDALGWQSTPGKESVLFKIQAPEGTHGAPGLVDIGGMSDGGGEVILAPGTSMKVVDVQKPAQKGTPWTVTVSLPPPG
jgi:hypothetical protein